MFANLKQKGTEFSNKAHRFFLPTEVTTIAKNLFSGGMLLYALPMMTMAAGIDDMFGTLISYVFKIFFYIGAVLLAWSIGQLIMAFKNEDADSKSRAVMVIVVSCLLMSAGGIYSAAVTALGKGNISIKDVTL